MCLFLISFIGLEILTEKNKKQEQCSMWCNIEDSNSHFSFFLFFEFDINQYKT